MAEDTLHALWGCSGLNVVWDDERWSFRSREVFTDFKQLYGWLLEKGKPLQLFAIQDLKHAAQERWNEIRSGNPLPNPIRPQPKPKWSVPPLNKYKINYDGAISKADNKAGIGVVVRNCNGEVMASLIQQLEQAFQPVEVEVIAACRAVEFGSEIGVDCAIVEGDLEVIVKALRNNDNGLTPFAPLINDVSLFLGLFSELSYSHIKRDGNKVAHSLARLALTTPGCTVWMEDVPSLTLPFVQADLAAH
ncbi:uncharacterized protein LOC126690092 [Quercus robur]|uniref:uncharacterized protein LOC126690092 n=1 Tax=Quercus robur TaxID=38942 RepID=UPI002162B962|nr:uncharacterized protein LOC126690092 [Quercus robur]